MIGRKTALAGVAFSLVCHGLACAQQTANDPNATRKALFKACAADVKTLCAGVIPGGGRLMRCMQAHADKVSPGCRDAREQDIAARKAAEARAAAH